MGSLLGEVSPKTLWNVSVDVGYTGLNHVCG
jgi:hypothetical protein